MVEEQKVTTSVYVDKGVVNCLKKEAGESDRSLSWLINDILKRHVKRMVRRKKSNA
jgi:hypothetical protein